MTDGEDTDLTRMSLHMEKAGQFAGAPGDEMVDGSDRK